MKKANRGLGYDDVVLIPEVVNDIDSRDLIHINIPFCGILYNFHIIAAPMPDVCNETMAVELGKLGGLGILHRFQDIDKQVSSFCSCLRQNINVGCAIGIGEDWYKRFERLAGHKCKIFCIDVANGASTRVKHTIEAIRKSPYSNLSIIAGNVASAHGYKYLADLGVDAVRVGIAGGCFTSDTKVTTSSGPVNINKVNIGDMVLTHTGEYKPVSAKLERLENNTILDINGIKCTKNHEFYVVQKVYQDLVNDDNIHKYAEWISAEELSDKYFLIKIQE